MLFCCASEKKVPRASSVPCMLSVACSVHRASDSRHQGSLPRIAPGESDPTRVPIRILLRLLSWRAFRDSNVRRRGALTCPSSCSRIETRAIGFWLMRLPCKRVLYHRIRQFHVRPHPGILESHQSPRDSKSATHGSHCASAHPMTNSHLSQHLLTDAVGAPTRPARHPTCGTLQKRPRRSLRSTETNVAGQLRFTRPCFDSSRTPRGANAPQQT